MGNEPIDVVSSHNHTDQDRPEKADRSGKGRYYCIDMYRAGASEWRMPGW